MIAELTPVDLAQPVSSILKQQYIIPLYQRNYNWGEEQIATLLQDIYESFRNNPSSNYFIGSLVAFNRKINDFQYLEVIDGQQRLTTVVLISRLLGLKFNEKVINYDSRPEVSIFLNLFNEQGKDIRNIKDDSINEKLTGFYNAIKHILHTRLNGNADSSLTISSLNQGKFNDFANYFHQKVLMVLVEMPHDTDVASYFEIMNNRGKQLQEHEILKGRLMSQLKTDKDRAIFGRVWDACSQMNRPVHKFFSPEERSNLFGPDYDSFYVGGLQKLNAKGKSHQPQSILEILNTNEEQINKPSYNEFEDELDDNIEYIPIIDFSNFLIHILKLLYPKADVPLSSDKLLKIYNSISKGLLMEYNAMDFIKRLLFYRIVFDRYTIKSDKEVEAKDALEGTGNEDETMDRNARWHLSRPEMQWKNRKKYAHSYATLQFRNTFTNQDYQERIVKCLSMLQVTYRQRRNKNYLQFLLGLFDYQKPSTLQIKAEDFLYEMEGFALNQFNALALDFNNSTIATGTGTPHLIFNFTDYLYWLEVVWNNRNYPIDKDFDFTYRNSVEHHYPSALKDYLVQYDIFDTEITLNCLGNLCLVSKNANSKLSDREPIGKVVDGRLSKGNLTPKRRIMYQTTNQNKAWKEKEIWEHYSEVVELLQRRDEILNR